MAERILHDVQGPRALVYVAGTFDTNGSSAPDGITGDIDSVSRDGTGEYTVTLKHSYPQLDFADANVAGDEPTLDAKVTDDTIDKAGGGTLKVKVYEEADDGADTDPDNGISAAADTTDKTVRVVAFVRNTTGKER